MKKKKEKFRAPTRELNRQSKVSALLIKIMFFFLKLQSENEELAIRGSSVLESHQPKHA
jgi:hypothetical protein